MCSKNVCSQNWIPKKNRLYLKPQAWSSWILLIIIYSTDNKAAEARIQQIQILAYTSI